MWPQNLSKAQCSIQCRLALCGHAKLAIQADLFVKSDVFCIGGEQGQWRVLLMDSSMALCNWPADGDQFPMMQHRVWG